MFSTFFPPDSYFFLTFFPSPSNKSFSPVAGAQEKIANLRYRHEVIANSVAQLENRVATNTAELEQMRHSYDDDDDDFSPTPVSQSGIPEVTDEEIEREMAEIAELERKKRALEARVTGMDRDLGGLMG
jgi:hypothetical protein